MELSCWICRKCSALSTIKCVESIAAKRKAFKAWRTFKDTRASYDAAKRIGRHAVHHARQEADKKIYENTDPSLQKSTALLTNLEERTLMLLVTNR